MEPEPAQPVKSYFVKRSTETEAEFMVRSLSETTYWQTVYKKRSNRLAKAEADASTPRAKRVRPEDLKVRNRAASRRLRERQVARTKLILESNIKLREELDELKASRAPEAKAEPGADLALRKELLDLRAAVDQQNATIRQQAELLVFHMQLVNSCYFCHCRLMGCILRNASANTPGTSTPFAQPEGLGQGYDPNAASLNF